MTKEETDFNQDVKDFIRTSYSVRYFPLSSSNLDLFFKYSLGIKILNLKYVIYNINDLDCALKRLESLQKSEKKTITLYSNSGTESKPIVSNLLRDAKIIKKACQQLQIDKFMLNNSG